MRRRRAAGWLWAGGLLCLATAARFALGRPPGVLPFITFAPAIALTTLLAGWESGAAVLILSALIASRYFLPVSLSPFLAGGNAAMSLAGFLFLSTLLIALIAGLVALLRTTVAQRERLRGYTSLQDMRYEELQHRVANSLQAVGGILETGKIKIARGGDPIAVLEEAYARIDAAAQFQRTLVNQVPSPTGFEDALRRTLRGVFGDLPVAITLEIAADRLASDKITPLLLLVVEAATNSMKHAFKADRASTFYVGLQELRRDALALTVRDDGTEWKEPSPPSGAPRGYGFHVMELLAAQLGGKLVVETSNGTTLRVEFPSHAA